VAPTFQSHRAGEKYVSHDTGRLPFAVTDPSLATAILWTAVMPEASVRVDPSERSAVRTTSAVRVIVAGGLAGVLAGCGGGGTASSNQPTAAGASAATSDAATSAAATSAAQGGLDALSADDIAKKAIDRLTKASSVRIRGSLSDSGDKITIDETEVLGKGCEGTFVLNGKGSFQIKIVGASTWIDPDQAFWKSQGLKDPTAVAMLSGKWIKLSPKSDLSALAQLCTLPALLGKQMSDPAGLGLQKGETSTRNGQQALALKDSGNQGTLYVSTNAAPELLELASTADKTTLTFSNYDAKVTLAAPPAAKTIDGKKFGV